jgi:transcriptional regulator with XRE-family HTH domain
MQMNTPEVQHLKMAWLAAKEIGDSQAQMRLLLDHPQEQTALVDFIAANHMVNTTSVERGVSETPLLALTQRACQRALERIFEPELALANLSELRKSRQLSKIEAAKGLQLGIDVWNKFEEGAIELVSLSQRQLQHLAEFFQVSVEQFRTLHSQSQPVFTANRRQTRQAADQEQGPHKQTFADAIDRSTMSKEQKQLWLE